MLGATTLAPIAFAAAEGPQSDDRFVGTAHSADGWTYRGEHQVHHVDGRPVDATTR